MPSGAKMLARLQKDAGRNDRSLLSLARQLAQCPRDPRLKLFVTWRILQFRRQHAGLFRLGEYIPLAVGGPQAKHVCAFAWEGPASSGPGRQSAIVIAPCLVAQLTPLGSDARRPRRRWVPPSGWTRTSPLAARPPPR